MCPVPCSLDVVDHRIKPVLTLVNHSLSAGS